MLKFSLHLDGNQIWYLWLLQACNKPVQSFHSACMKWLDGLPACLIHCPPPEPPQSVREPDLQLQTKSQSNEQNQGTELGYYPTWSLSGACSPCSVITSYTSASLYFTGLQTLFCECSSAVVLHAVHGAPVCLHWWCICLCSSGRSCLGHRGEGGELQEEGCLQILASLFFCHLQQTA